MTKRRLFRIFTDLLGNTPFHPQFFSRSFLNRQVRFRARQLTGVVADIGCGFEPYKKHFTWARYFGLDYPAARASDRVKDIDAFVDLTSLSLADTCLDGVLCTQVLEHISEPTKAVAEIGRVLKRGGKLLLSFPFFYPLHDEPYDYFRYSQHGIRRLLSDAGLQIIEVVPQGGFVTMSGEFFNLFCIHKIQNLLDSGICLRILGFCSIPPFLTLAFLINLICIILSPLDRERRFVMNYFVYAERY